MGSWIGVDLFFVLSGFLISGLLFKEHQRFNCISFKNFFIRRGLKIYPPFYAVIFITFLIYCIRGSTIIPPISWISELFFFQDYVKGVWTQNWSLGVEEKFYILLPLLLILLSKINRSKKDVFRAIPMIFISISITLLILRIWVALTKPYSFFTFYAPFHLRMDSLFFGVLISYFYHYHPFRFRETVRRFKYMMLITGMILLIPPFIIEKERSPLFILSIGFIFYYSGFGLILTAVVESNIKTTLLTRLLTCIGRHSYSIYLWHMSISIALLRLIAHAGLIRHTWLLYSSSFILISITFGICMSKLIEVPSLKLRERLFPSRSRSPIGQYIAEKL